MINVKDEFSFEFILSITNSYPRLISNDVILILAITSGGILLVLMIVLLCFLLKSTLRII